MLRVAKLLLHKPDDLSIVPFGDMLLAPPSTQIVGPDLPSRGSMWPNTAPIWPYSPLKGAL